MGEAGHLARAWWCRGCGAAVAGLALAVWWFRPPGNPMFWAAAAFLAVHTVLATARWRSARRRRASATVLRHHDAAVWRGAPAFPPLPPLAPLKVTGKQLQQTKNPL